MGTLWECHVNKLIIDVFLNEMLMHDASNAQTQRNH